MIRASTDAGWVHLTEVAKDRMLEFLMVTPTDSRHVGIKPS